MNLREYFECLLEASWACATKKLVDAKVTQKALQKALQGLRQKDIHQECPWGTLLWVLLAATPEDNRKWLWVWSGERREDFKVKTKPALTFPDLSGRGPGGCSPGPSGFPAAHSPFPERGVPQNLPLSHRGPFLGRAPGPLSVPETKTIPLMSPTRHSKPCPRLNTLPFTPTPFHYSRR